MLKHPFEFELEPKEDDEPEGKKRVVPVIDHAVRTDTLDLCNEARVPMSAHRGTKEQKERKCHIAMKNLCESLLNMTPDPKFRDTAAPHPPRPSPKKKRQASDESSHASSEESGSEVGSDYEESEVEMESSDDES